MRTGPVVSLGRCDVLHACQALRSACEERDTRISDLEVQALRNTATIKMLSSALEVPYMSTNLAKLHRV